MLKDLSNGPLALFQEQWSPRVVAEVNDYQLKLVRLQGEFVWHAHHDTDKAFLVLAGELVIDLRDRSVRLGAGEPSGSVRRHSSNPAASSTRATPADRSPPPATHGSDRRRSGSN